MTYQCQSGQGCHGPDRIKILIGFCDETLANENQAVS